MGTQYSEIGATILHEFAGLPDIPTTLFFSASANQYIQAAENGIKPWEDALFFAGAELVHAKANAGVLGKAQKIPGGYYVENEYGWEKKDFATMVSPIAANSYAVALTQVPDSIQRYIQPLYPAWFKDGFGMDYSEDLFGLVTNATPIVMPFDHFTEARTFVGGDMHYPQEFNRPTFKYMKQWTSPPTVWYSDRGENDFEGYVRSQALLAGVSVKDFVSDACTHESAHIVAIDPAVDLVLGKGVRRHCWLSEGVAIYFGERIGKNLKLNSVKEVPAVRSIIETDTTALKYSHALLLTMALAIRSSGSTKNVDGGMEQIVKEVSERAKQVVDETAQPVRSHSELFRVVAPQLDIEKADLELGPIMQAILAENIL